MVSKERAMLAMTVFTSLVWGTWLLLAFTVGGFCPQPMTDPSFEVDRYVGRWYEFAREENFYQDGECTTAQYFELPNNYISVNNREFKVGAEKQRRSFDDYGDGFFAECSSI